MDAKVEVISPAYAKELLELAEPNRPLSETVVARYAADMTDGLFINNGQGIILSDVNTLLDGQHRLAAIIRSGQTIAMLVVRGVPKAAFVTMDSGKGRVLSDVLSIEGYKNRFTLASAAKLAWTFIAGVSNTYSVSRSTLEQFLRRHPYLAETVDLVCSTAPFGQRFPRTAAATVVFLGNESHRHDKQVSEFLEGLIYGEGLHRQDARYTLREWYQRVYIAEHKTGHGAAASMGLFGAVVRAWNAYGAGQTLQIIRNNYGLTSTNTDIYGFDPKLYGDVQNIAVQNREVSLRNLRLAQQRNNMTRGHQTQAEQKRERDAAKAKAQAELTKSLRPAGASLAGTPIVPPKPGQAQPEVTKISNAKQRRMARMKVFGAAARRAARRVGA